MTPLVIVDITEGVEQASWTFAGEGVPELLIQDFDRDGMTGDDDLPYLIERAELFARALRSRHLVDCDHIANCHGNNAMHYENTAEEWRVDLAENARSAEEDRRVEQLRDERSAEAAERAGMAPGELAELFGK